MLGPADVEPGRWQKQNDGDDDGDNNDGNSSNNKQDWNRKNVQSRESRSDREKAEKTGEACTDREWRTNKPRKEGTAFVCEISLS